MDSTPVVRKILFDCFREGAPLLVNLKEVRHIDGSGVASLLKPIIAPFATALAFPLPRLVGRLCGCWNSRGCIRFFPCTTALGTACAGSPTSPLHPLLA